MAQVLRKNTGNGGFVEIWRMEESVDELLNCLELSTEDLAQVHSYRLTKRKLEFLTTRCLIKEVIKQEPIITYLASGRPILKNSEYKISISHTKNYVAVAFSKAEYVGVDIEYPSERVAKIYKRFVSDLEEQFIPDDRKIEYYSMMWSLKESMYKMYDRQSSIFNVNFICHPFVLQKEGEIQATFDFEDSETLNFHYLATEDYYLVYHC